MKRLCFLLLAITFLAACYANTDIGAKRPAPTDNRATSGILDETAEPIQTTGYTDSIVETAVISERNLINGSAISSVIVEDLSVNEHSTYNSPELINELLQQIGNQIYKSTDKLNEVTHRAEFRSPDGKQILVIDFGYNIIAVNRDVTIGQASFKEGVYEAGETPWSSFSFYLDQLEEGYVMEPVDILMPASIRIPDQYWKLKMTNKGNDRINKYEACPMMHEFVENFVVGKEFIITDSKRYFDYEEMQTDKLGILNSGQCLEIEFVSSDTRLEIDIKSNYKGLAMAGSITLAKLTDKPGEYALITDKMILSIKPRGDSTNGDFSRGFTALFDDNSGKFEEISPDGIKELFDNNKPYYMEFVCSNLGIGEWSGREPDRLEIKEMKLDISTEPYTVVHIYNPFDLRMLVYKSESNGSFSFAGDIVFGGRSAGTEYELITAKDKVWIKGANCKGYGTGVSMYYSDWYHVTEDGVKLALSYPHDAYMDGPYGGYSVNANEAATNKSKDMRVQVTYDAAKRYYLFLNIADEYGAIELKGKKKVEFLWNSEKGIFEADNEEGTFDINADCPKIDQQCDALLKEHYEQLSGIIASLAAENSENHWKAGGIRAFLLDCSDSMQKEKLLKELYVICPEIQG